MIQIARLLARRLRAVFRRCTPRTSHRPPLLHFIAGRNGLHIQLNEHDVAVQYHATSDIHSPEELVLPLTALQDFESGKPEPVHLEKLDGNRVQATWTDRGVPQVKVYEGKEAKELPQFPPVPAMTSIDRRLLQALTDAQGVTAPQSVRYATDKLQLRKTGKIVATDGRHLLVQEGFNFPFKEDLIVPALQVWTLRELENGQPSPLTIGKGDKHLAVKVGPWTFWLTIDKDGRFPHVEDVLPRADKVVTRLSVLKGDAAYLIHTLPKLPGNGETDSVVTVDANGKLTIRAKGANQPKPTEVVLAHSQVTGKPERFKTNRNYLVKALSLGFNEFQIVNGDTPIACRAATRTYGWMPLGRTGVILPTEDCIRIVSTDLPVKTTTPTPTKGTPTVANNHPQNGTHRHIKRQRAGARLTLLGEVMALKSALRDSARRANQLAGVVRKQQRQSKIVGNALKSLRELEQSEKK